jgi:hypothetical protein
MQHVLCAYALACAYRPQWLANSAASSSRPLYAFVRVETVLFAVQCFVLGCSDRELAVLITAMAWIGCPGCVDVNPRSCHLPGGVVFGCSALHGGCSTTCMRHATAMD